MNHSRSDVLPCLFKSTAFALVSEILLSTFKVLVFESHPFV